MHVRWARERAATGQAKPCWCPLPRPSQRPPRPPRPIPARGPGRREQTPGSLAAGGVAWWWWVWTGTAHARGQSPGEHAAIDASSHGAAAAAAGAGRHGRSGLPLFIPACLGSIHPSLSFFSPASNPTEHTAPLATPSLHWQAALVGLVRRFQFGYFNQVCPVLQSKVKVTASCKPSPHSTSYKSSSPAAAGEKHNEPSRGKCSHFLHFPDLLSPKPLLLYLFPSRPVSSKASSSDRRPLRDEH